MKKTIVRIDGMMCGMCEAHICDQKDFFRCEEGIRFP